MSKYFNYVVSVFLMALMIGAIESNPVKAGELPPNHEELAEICLCFGRFFNGFNATRLPPSGRCARSQTGPFCFVDTALMPIFWKKIERGSTRPTRVTGGEVVEHEECCDPGKMVLSCMGGVTVGDTPEPAANVALNCFPSVGIAGPDTCCRCVARSDRGTEERVIRVRTIAVCAAPGPFPELF